MGKSGLELYFDIHRAPSELLLPSAKNLPSKAEFAGQVFLKGHGEFQSKKFQTTFHHYFMPKISISRLEILVHL